MLWPLMLLVVSHWCTNLLDSFFFFFFWDSALISSFFFYSIMFTLLDLRINVHTIATNIDCVKALRSMHCLFYDPMKKKTWNKIIIRCMVSIINHFLVQTSRCYWYFIEYGNFIGWQPLSVQDNTKVDEHQLDSWKIYLCQHWIKA